MPTENLDRIFKLVPVAHKLVVIMDAEWRDGAAFADRPHAGGASGDAPTAKARKVLGVGALRSGPFNRQPACG